MIKHVEELIMARKNKQHSLQFKLDAVNYRKEHPDLTQEECAKNLGTGLSTLARWERQFRDNNGTISVRGTIMSIPYIIVFYYTVASINVFPQTSTSFSPCFFFLLKLKLSI